MLRNIQAMCLLFIKLNVSNPENLYLAPGCLLLAMAATDLVSLGRVKDEESQLGITAICFFNLDSA